MVGVGERCHLTGVEAVVEVGRRLRAKSFNCSGAGDSSSQVPRAQVTWDIANALGQHAQVDQKARHSKVS